MGEKNWLVSIVHQLVYTTYCTYNMEREIMQYFNETKFIKNTVDENIIGTLSDSFLHILSNIWPFSIPPKKVIALNLRCFICDIISLLHLWQHFIASFMTTFHCFIFVLFLISLSIVIALPTIAIEALAINFLYFQ